MLYNDVIEPQSGNFFIELLRSVWNSIKRFFVKCLNFAKNIVGFFRNPRHLKTMSENPDIIATSIKENLENGDYYFGN